MKKQNKNDLYIESAVTGFVMAIVLAVVLVVGCALFQWSVDVRIHNTVKLECLK